MVVERERLDQGRRYANANAMPTRASDNIAYVTHPATPVFFLFRFLLLAV